MSLAKLPEIFSGEEFFAASPMLPPTPRSPASDNGVISVSVPVDGESAEETEWKSVASSMMTEAVGLLERLCALSETVERQCLLGSAYKRQALIGMGESVQGNLTAAAKVRA